MNKTAQNNAFDIAAEIMKVEIATDPAMQAMVCEKVIDAARGNRIARNWLLSREGSLCLDGFNRFLEESGTVPKKVLSGVVTRR